MGPGFVNGITPKKGPTEHLVFGNYLRFTESKKERSNLQGKPMIHTIKGMITAVSGQQIVVDCGSLAFTLQVPDEKAFTLNSQLTVFSHLHWNQEQGPTLFGFSGELDRIVFLLIISCSGLGPKIALAILAQMGVQPFLTAITSGDEQALSRVSGIGAKKAEQMIVHLKHKVEKLLKSGIELGEQSQSLQHWNNVADVLTSLSYTRAEITRTMKYLGDMYTGQSIPFDQLMRQALSFLSKKA